MPRLPRVYVEGSLYYITCRGAANQMIFKDAKDYEMYFGLLKKYKGQYGVKLFTYNLMPSHLHLLVEVDEKTSISSVMHDLTSAYTKYFNSRYKTKGHLFRERYRAALVEKEPKILSNLSCYIHLNPKKLNLVVQAQTYPYSSYSLYLDYTQESDRGLAIKNEITEILNSLLGENYLDFVNKIEKSGELQSLHQRLHRKRVLGSDEFIQKVKERIEDQKIEPVIDAEIKKENKKVSSGLDTALLILLIAATGTYVYFNFTRTPSLEQKPKAETAESPKLQDKLVDLDKTQWEIKLISQEGKLLDSDVISFNNGKFNSVNFSQQNFENTNYSIIKERDKITWETMQVSNQKMVSWRGEIEEGKMSGMLSLRQEGKAPQDFSFISITYRRK